MQYIFAASGSAAILPMINTIGIGAASTIGTLSLGSTDFLTF